MFGVLLMPLAAFAKQGDVPPPPLAAYTNTDYGFELKLPTDWQMSENNEDGTVVEANYMSEGQAPASVNVTTSTSDSNFKTELANAKASLSQLIPGYKKKVDKAFKIKGAQARILGGTFKVEGSLLKIEQLIVMKGQKIFVITASAQNSDWSKHKKNFDKIFKSFKVL